MAGMDHFSEWTAARMAVIASGSWIAAMTRILPPQCGHFRASMVHTLIERSAQLMRPGRFWDHHVTGAAPRAQLRWARAVREALDLQETAGLRVCDAAVVGELALPARELVGEDPDDRRGELCVEGDRARGLTGQRKDPLAVRYLWPNAVHQARRLLVHAPARAGRAEPHLSGDRAASPGDHAGASA